MDFTDDEKLTLRQILANQGTDTLLSYMIQNMDALKSAGAASVTALIAGLGQLVTKYQAQIDNLEAIKAAEQTRLTALRDIAQSIKTKLEAP